MQPSKKLLLPLTGFRFFLAIWVVIFHQSASDGSIGHLVDALPHPLPVFFLTGYLAVAFFFALSGFVLAYNYPLDHAWSRVQVARFAIARFSRIYPAYLVGQLLIARFILGYLFEDFSPIALGKQLFVTSLNLTLLQTWLPKFALSWNFPGWSLSNEAFFYACFPFIGVVLWKRTSPRSRITASLLIFAASLIPLLLATSMRISGYAGTPLAALSLQDRHWVNFLTYFPLLNLPEFCVGILLGRAYSNMSKSKSQYLDKGHWIYLPALLMELVVIAYFQSPALLLEVLLLPLHALVILGFALGGGILTRALSLPVMVFLGNASYAMYIIHIPVSLWMKSLSNQIYGSDPKGLMAFSLYIAVVIALSAIIFKWIEEPANRYLKKVLNSRVDALFGPQPRTS